LAVGCATLRVAESSPKATPVIPRFFASTEVTLGEIWKIYLDGPDSNGEMTKIFGTVEQPGQINLVRITKVSKENAKEFSSYSIFQQCPC